MDILAHQTHIRVDTDKTTHIVLCYLYVTHEDGFITRIDGPGRNDLRVATGTAGMDIVVTCPTLVAIALSRSVDAGDEPEQRVPLEVMKLPLIGDRIPTGPEPTGSFTDPGNNVRLYWDI